MAYSDSFPAIRPSFQFSADAGRLDPRISYSRSTVGSFYGKDKHLSSENLLTDSNGFPAYSTSGVATPSVSGTFLDGTDAFVVTETATNNSHFIYSPLHQFENGKQYTATVFVKAGTASSIQLLFNNNVFSSTVYANYDLATPTNAPVAGADATATSTGLSDGWVKITLTGTATSSALYALLYVVFNNDDINSARAPIYTPASAKNFYIWNAQVSTTGETVLNETSGQIHREYAPTLQTAAINAPRFEHSASDSASAAIGSSRGLLIESASTNLVSYSESFSNHSVSNSTLTENAAVGPTGTLNANLLVPTSSGTSTRNINLNDGNPISHTSGNNYAFSIYAKAAGYNYLQWVGGAYFGYTYCNFDLTNGTVGSKSSTVTGQAESVGNGWYRLTVIAAATQTNSSTSKGIWSVITSSTEARNATMTGDGYSGVLLTMAQCELSSFASSYIKSNSGSATTRAADSASMVDANLFDNGGGGLVAEYDMFAASETSYVAHLNKTSGGTNGGGVAITNRYVYVENNYLNVGNLPSNTFHKVAASWEPSSQKISRNGGAAAEDTLTVVPSGIDKLYIGQRQDGGEPVNGHIKRLAIYSEPLSSTNLQALTS